MIGTGGVLDTPNQRLPVEHVPSIVTPDDLRQGRARSAPDGQPVRLGDIAEVVKDHQPLFGDAVVNDGPGLLLIVEKFPWANTLDVTRGVEQALEELKPGLPGIDIDTTIFRPASFIEIGARQPVGRARCSAACSSWPSSWRSCSSGAPRSSAWSPSRCRCWPPGSCCTARADDQHDGPGRAGDLGRGGRRRRDHRRREHRATAAPAPARGQRQIDGIASSSTPRSRSAARSSTRRSSTSSRSSRCSSSQGCPGLLPAAGRCPTAWPSSRRCWSR